MGIPPNVRHILFVIIVVAGAGVHALMPLEPQWSILITAASMLSVLGAVFTDAPGTAAKMAALKASVRVGGLGVILFCCVRCSWLQSPQGQTGIAGGVATVVCVLNHITESPPQILTDCGPGAVSSVIATIDAAHKAGDTATLISVAGARTTEEVNMVLDAHVAAMVRAKDGGL